MSPSAFNEETDVINGPPEIGGVDVCDPISICRTQTEGGTPVVVSCWRPTKYELAEIVRTGRVWLSVVGETMPPVAVDGCRPSFLEGSSK